MLQESHLRYESSVSAMGDTQRTRVHKSKTGRCTRCLERRTSCIVKFKYERRGRWSRTEQRTRNVAGESSSLRSAACQQWEIRKERESIRVKSGIVFGILREGPHAQQSSNMSDETAGVEPSRELRVSRESHLRYRAQRVNDERYA